MYAVFRSGGKQYRASEGDRVRVERLDAEQGEAVEFDQVLMVGDGADVTLGSPLVEDSRVQGIVTAQGRGKKIVVTKFKRRKNYKRIMGHRQHFTEVEITSIGSGSTEAEERAIDEEESAVEAEVGAVEVGAIGAEVGMSAADTEKSVAEVEGTAADTEASAAEAESATGADASEPN